MKYSLCYLVTGGAGFIGSHITHTLLEQGHSVRVLDNFSSGKHDNLAFLLPFEKSGQLEILKGDIRNKKTVEQAVKDIHIIFHEAAFVSVSESLEKPQEYFDVNINGTGILLDAARNARVKRVVFASSAAIYGDQHVLPLTEDLRDKPMSPYAVSKRVDEMYGVLYSQFFGLEVVGLRYFNVYGPRQSCESLFAAVVPIFIQALQRGESMTIYGDGNQTRDLIFVSDVVRANLIAAEHPDAAGQIFNICTGQETPILDLVNDLMHFFPKAANPVFDNPRLGDIYQSLGCPKKAEKIMGFKAITSLKEGLKIIVENAYYVL